MERVTNSLMTVETLRLTLCNNLLTMLNVFMNLTTKITISIPEESSVAITSKEVKASIEPVHFKPATINLPPYFEHGNRKLV